MKKLSTLLFAAFSTLVLADTANAQIRNIDMEISVTEPASGTVIQPNANFVFKIILKNNGPDNFVTGDTIFYQASFSSQVQIALLNRNINMGETAEIPITLTNSNKSGQDQTANICVKFFDPNSEVTINQQPPNLTYQDTDTSNNLACVTNITLKTAPQSIEGLETVGNALNLYPNPASDRVSFNYTAARSNEEVSVVVTDILGREVLVQSLGTTQAGLEKTYTVDVASLKAGNYMMIIRSGQEQATGRIIITK